MIGSQKPEKSGTDTLEPPYIVNDDRIYESILNFSKWRKTDTLGYRITNLCTKNQVRNFSNHEIFSFDSIRPEVLGDKGKQYVQRTGKVSGKISRDLNLNVKNDFIKISLDLIPASVLDNFTYLFLFSLQSYRHQEHGSFLEPMLRSWALDPVQLS